MLVTFAGIVIEVSADALRKALSPIVTTVFGIETLVNPDAFLNASVAIEVTPDGIVATPAHDVFVVTTLLSTVNEPESTPATLHGAVVPPPFASAGLAAIPDTVRIIAEADETMAENRRI